LLICQQRFLFNVYYFFHKKRFFILGVNVFYIYDTWWLEWFCAPIDPSAQNQSQVAF